MSGPNFTQQAQQRAMQHARQHQQGIGHILKERQKQKQTREMHPANMPNSSKSWLRTVVIFPFRVLGALIKLVITLTALAFASYVVMQLIGG